MLAFLRSAFSVANLIWVLLLAPAALISTIEDFSNWRSILYSPIGHWHDELVRASASLPIFNQIPRLLISPLYFLILIFFVFFTFTFTVSLEAQRQKRLAMAIDFGKVEADSYQGSPGESLMEGAVGAAAAGVLGLSGPLGWMVAIGVMGAMMATRWAVEQNERDRHARAQTDAINARREKHIDEAVGRFVREERQRLLIAAGLAVIVVVGSFIVGR